MSYMQKPINSSSPASANDKSSAEHAGRAKWKNNTRHDEQKEGFRRKRSFDKSSRNEDVGIRVEKKIADLMQCPKSNITKLIQEGKIKVNNIVVKDMSLKVTFDDTIHVNGRQIENKRVPIKVYIFNKPKGYIVTNNDPEGRQTIFDIIPSRLGKLITVGRLDFNSEGLMLLTNNGDFARAMELPATGAERRYRVRVFGDVDLLKLEAIKDGIEIKGIRYGRVVVTVEHGHKEDGSNRWLQVVINEGKNREVRNIMEHFGLQVNRLIRIGYGKYNLGTLPVGCAMEVKPIPVSAPKNNIGHKRRYNDVSKFDGAKRKKIPIRNKNSHPARPSS